MNEAIERIFGKLLWSVRGHDSHLACNSGMLKDVPASLFVESPAFSDGSPMFAEFAADTIGRNLSPPLAWTGVPPQAAELVLIMQDPDAPMPRPIVHALASGIQPSRSDLPKGALTAPGDQHIRLHKDSLGRIGYYGPRPVVGHGPHRYVFQLVAADRPLPVSPSDDYHGVLKALQGHAIAKGMLIGTFERR
jgi:Raf kinase inhibitor-like YbhB/YbcL family protein